MISVEHFDSIEEMLEAIAKDELEAESHIKDWQRQIDVGDCFCRFYQQGLIIFCRVVASHKDNDNYLFCWCFSDACPEGEYGDVHRSVADMRLTENVFKKYLLSKEPDHSELKQYAEEDGLVFERKMV